MSRVLNFVAVSNLITNNKCVCEGLLVLMIVGDVMGQKIDVKF